MITERKKNKKKALLRTKSSTSSADETRRGSFLHRRRRGTHKSKKNTFVGTLLSSSNALCVLLALCATVFAMGYLLVGLSRVATTESKSYSSDHHNAAVGVGHMLRERLKQQNDKTSDQKSKQQQQQQQQKLLQGNEKHATEIIASDNKKDSTFKAKYPYKLTPVSHNHDFTTWSPPGPNRYAEYKNGNVPFKITPSLKKQSDNVARSRRVHIKNAMKHAWNNGYKKYAFGKDEVSPMDGTPRNNWGGMGITLVDALDTLWLMDMKDEFWEARDWVRDNLFFDNVTQTVSTFETTVRSLGGLLSAYDWSQDEIFLDKAVDLGERLSKAFLLGRHNNPLPTAGVNLATGAQGEQNSKIADAGTLQIEFRQLAKVSGRIKYKILSENVFEVLRTLKPTNGLYPYRLSHGKIAGNVITFGAMGDSFYEYMLKLWLQGGKTETKYRTMWDESMEGMHNELMQKSFPFGLWYIAETTTGGEINPKFDHLTCFMGGALALGAYTDPEGLDSPRAQRDLKSAKSLAYTCYQMYARSPTGISPEAVRFTGDNDFVGGPNYYLLRPETVETFFILNYLTGDPIYREWGWEVFQAIERYCKNDVAYASLNDVNYEDSQMNLMESFFLAETLKYLYLLFDPDTEVDILNKHVFNTEAHPTRIFPVLQEESPEMVGMYCRKKILTWFRCKIIDMAGL